MANPAVTNTFVSGTSAKAAEVNTNFSDLVNAMTDSTKTFTIFSILVTSGSAVAPSVAGSSFSTTGLFWAAGPTLGIAIGGTSYLEVTSATTLLKNAVTLGTSSGLGTSAGAYHTLDGALVSAQGSTGSIGHASIFNLGANIYRDGGATAKAISTVTGYTYQILNRTTSASGQVWAIEANYQDAQTADSSLVNTNVKEVVSVDASGNMTILSGHLLPTSGGTPANLNYYEEGTVSANFSSGAGASGANTSKTLTFRRIGKIVTLTFPSSADMTCGTTSSNFAAAAGTLASRLRPSVSIRQPLRMSTNGTISNTPGFVIVDTDGSISLFRDLAGTATFTSTQTNNGPEAFSINYSV